MEVMPIYLYGHTNSLLNEFCGGKHWTPPYPERGEFEIEQKITELPLTKCPKCGHDVKRLVAGGTSFKFTGGSPTAKHFNS